MEEVEVMVVLAKWPTGEHQVSCTTLQVCSRHGHHVCSRHGHHVIDVIDVNVDDVDVIDLDVDDAGN